MAENKDMIAGYMDFLTRGKTERECCELIVEIARAHGYKNIDECKSLKAG
ncbi:MAG TPA: aminopeptidase, partial [Treponema sp.]|nr:aminopeptidase [Treponema sp.]